MDCPTLGREQSARPGPDVLALLRAAVVTAIVGNADDHGKNLSLLHRRGGPRLAPLYDLLATAPYPDLSPTFAMKIWRRSTQGDPDAEGWERCALQAGVGWPFARQRVGEIAARADGPVSPLVTGPADVGIRLPDRRV